MMDYVNFEGPYTAQGDLNIFECHEIPGNLVESKADQHVLAHSETGHNHVIDANCARVFNDPDNEFVSYLEVKKTADIVHLRSFDTHTTIRIPPGTYRITRQREYTPEGYRRAID